MLKGIFDNLIRFKVRKLFVVLYSYKKKGAVSYMYALRTYTCSAKFASARGSGP